MQRLYLILAAISGLLAVVLGAFGAHVIKTAVAPNVLEIYETGIRYQFYHTFALLAVGILFAWFPGKALQTSGLLFVIGMVLFSGSLYLITYLESAGKAISPGVGVITPIGGLFLIGGWIALLIALWGKKPG